MLKSLHITDFAIIDDLTIDFDESFNVFTGETGAGKSIIIGALSYLIGGRNDSSMIKKGAQKAVIEGVFSIDDKEVEQKLNDALIDYDGEVIVKRVISSSGHSSIRVNQSSVTLNFLEDLLKGQVDVHSQRDSGALYDKKKQLSILDHFIGPKPVYNEYQDAFRTYRELLKEYDDLSNQFLNEQEEDYLRYQLNELENASIDIEEENELLAQEKIYKNSEKYLTQLNNAIELYDGQHGIHENLYSLLNSLDADQEELSKIKEDIENCYYILEDKMEELRRFNRSLASDNINIDQVEERLFTYSRLKRKYHKDTNELIAYRNDISKKLDLVSQKEDLLSQIKEKIQQAKNTLEDAAQHLSSLRHENALILEEKINLEAKDLLLQNCNFSIRFQETDYNAKGNDEIEFYVSMNKGEDPHPLKNTASGGEVSRFMLALKTVLASFLDVSLMIFDEIDTGISGKAALAVGNKISQIAKERQVICITHLAQVASFADSHYYIYKADQEDTTLTKVKKLDEKEIIEELAMISSSEISDSSLSAAKELYEKSHKIT